MMLNSQRGEYLNVDDFSQPTISGPASPYINDGAQIIDTSGTEWGN